MQMKRRFPSTPRAALIGLWTALGASGCYHVNALDQDGEPDRSSAVACGPSYSYSTRQTASDYDGVDLLVVVDNSSSMLEEQAILSTGFFTLINSLALPLENDPDWAYPPVDNIRVAIVTSDMGLQWGGGQIGGNSVPVFQCDDIGDNGAFQMADPSVTTINIANDSIKCELRDDGSTPQCPAGFTCDVDPATRMGTCRSVSGAGTVNCEMFQGAWAETDPNTPDPTLTTQVACLANQGALGCGVEQQLEAGVRGLVNHSEFMVKTHLLAVLVVSDEEDCSVESNEFFNTPEWLTGTLSDGLLNVACNYPEANEQFLYDPAGYFDRFVALKNGSVSAVIFAAIVGVPYDNGDMTCQGNGEALIANDCLAHDAMQIEIETFTFTDGTTYKHFSPACTRAEGVAEVTSARPGRRYVEVAQEFGANGYVYSICNRDWGPAMESIAEIIARQITTSCFPDRLDWATLSKDDPRADECARCGESRCDLFVEVVRVGDDVEDESCPGELYASLSAEAREALLEKKHVEVETREGEVTRKTINCAVPKLPTPLDCDEALDRIAETTPGDTVGWYYCEKAGERFDDACKDELDNDTDGHSDCFDPECQDCRVCGGTGVDCEKGCRYGVQILKRATQLMTGHFVSVKCDPKFSGESC